MAETARRFTIPFRIFVLTLMLLGVGMVAVYSSSASYAALKRRAAVSRKAGAEALAEDHRYHETRFLERQILWVALGLVVMMVTYRVDYRRLKDAGLFFLLGSFVLLLLVFVPGIGRRINGDARWIGFFGQTLQPSEFAKLGLVIYTARMLDNHRDRIKKFLHGVMPALCVTGVFALAIILETDIGAAFTLTSIVFVMWFIGGMRLLHLGGLIAAVIPAFVWVVLMHPHGLRRLMVLVHPTAESLKAEGYQTFQSLIAIGSGGVWGVGLGNSMQKYFLPQPYADYVLAIIAEEMGFWGAAFVVGCFFLLILEGWRVALRAPDFYATLLASGLTLMIMVNVLLNMAVTLGLAPTTGVVLPLISYGGTSMIVTMASIGILMNIGKYIERHREEIRPAREKRRVQGDEKRRWWLFGRLREA